MAASWSPELPFSHCWSRNVDHIDTHAISFSSANVRTCAASESVNVSLAMSFTPIIEVSGIGWILIAVFIVLCGWVEDVAAKKKPGLVP